LVGEYLDHVHLELLLDFQLDEETAHHDHLLLLPLPLEVACL
jgi:hypothetical protein